MAETAHRSILSVDRARRIVLDAVGPVEQEQAGIINALGRTLAEDLKTEAPMPAHDTAAKDGYAAFAVDTQGATGGELRSLSVLSSSSGPKHLERGTVLRVRIGDPLPEGADTVIETGSTYRPDNGPQVMVLAESKRWRNVVRAGSRAKAGEVLVEAGTLIGPGEMGLIASLGRPGVPVRRKPRVAVLTTGAGVVDIVEELGPGETRNSARYTLVGMLLECGCDLGRLIHVRDGRVGLERALEGCPVSSGCDAAIVAVGPGEKHDLAVRALAGTHSILFERVQMEPGAASAFGVANGMPVFVTSFGAVVEAFEALIRPGLLRLVGRRQTDRPVLRAALGATLKLSPGCVHYVRANTHAEDGVYVARPLSPATSSPASWETPNPVIVVPEEAETVKRGETVDVQPIRHE